MKTRIIEFEVIAGSQGALFRCLEHNRLATLKHIADICREDWADTDHTAGKPLPESDEDVIKGYFPDDPDSDGGDMQHCRIENSFDIDLSPPDRVVIAGDGTSLTLTLPDPGLPSGALSGTLIETPAFSEARELVDALESFILRLACAGFPVHAPEFQQCVTETLEHLVNEEVLGL